MSASPTVLVVEDNQDVREIITEFLSAYGFTVISAIDGKEGLDLFNKKSPDFVLADVLLPRTNGFQVCQTIKTGPRPVPVILMSALYKSRNLQQEGKVKYGADDYLIKPLDLMDLARRICKLLGIERPKPLDAPSPEPVITETDVQPDVGLAVDDEGDLERTPIEQVIGWLFQQQSTGRLAIDSYGIVRTMYIKEGLPIFVQSTVREEGFAHLLLVDGKVTAEQLAEAELKARATKTMLGKVLVDNQAINKADLAQYLIKEVDTRLMHILQLPAGKYTFTEDTSFLEKIRRPELDIFDLVYHAIRLYAPDERLRERFAPRLKRRVLKNEELLAYAGRFNWEEDHLDAFILIDGARTIAKLIEETGQTAEVIWQLLYTLEVFGIVRFQ